MTALLLGRDVIGLPVVTIDGGEDVAEVRELVFERDGALAGFTLNKRGFLGGRMQELLVAANVAAVGPAAVMIDSDGCLAADEGSTASVGGSGGGSGDARVFGDEVITESGSALGTITDVVVLCGGGLALVGYQLAKADKSTAFVPLPAQRSISGSHLVVPDELATQLRHDLTGLGEGVAPYKDGLET